ncbi:restriction endonuclease subunit S [Vibrio sp. Hep-1b-8]|uniref:restriction endonuclease subunit S n=1 Tax=Vibrio sp. Hep-1b-8 TaxID=2144187 RepID=UPI00110FFE57|nr:restriction endonuclease subunit S [Vibrio sp. Hep-1b-8]TMX36608.1 type I restriction endonuclease subunit S [Vibrio sp. Hep-1b-8]
MNGLPKGWINTQIGQVITLNEKLKGIDDEIECGFVPMALMPTAYRGFVNFETKTWGSCKKGFTQFKDDDVLLAKITPCFENGKGGIVKGLPNGIGAGSTEYFVLRCIDELIQPQYLHAFVKSKKFMDDCEVHMGGSVGHKRVPKDYLLKYEIPLAPLNEQIRITNKFDSILAKVDKAQVRLDKIPAILKRFRQSVLAAATSGGLTKEWREEHHALFKKKTLSEAGVVVKTGPFGSALHKSEYIDSGIPVINPMHISEGEIFPSDAMSITQEKFEELKAWKLKIGDVVVGRRGEMGRAAEVQEHHPDMLCGTGSMIVRTESSAILPAYLVIALRSPNAIQFFESNSVGSTMVNLNQKVIKALEIHFPSKSEQKEIVTRVNRLFRQANKVEKQYLDAKARLDRLTQSILAKAFRGELVAQDPNDEPAEKLLERIVAEKEQSKPKKTTRKRTTKAKMAEKE